MSKCPWPHSAVRMHLLLAGLGAPLGLLDHGRDRVRRLGRGEDPLGPRERDRGGEALPLRLGDRLEQPELVHVREQRRHAVVAQPARVHRVGDEPVAERVHLQQRREPGRVAEVVGVDPAGERRARGRARRPGSPGSSARPASPAGTGRTARRSCDPPPVQPTIRSGPASPAMRRTARAPPAPITVWCSSTWLSTEPSAYRVSADPPAASTASLIAMPSEPGESGSVGEHLQARLGGPRRATGARSRRTSASACGGAASGRRRRGPSRSRSRGRTARRRTPARCPTGPAPVSVVSRLVPSTEL